MLSLIKHLKIEAKMTLFVVLAFLSMLSSNIIAFFKNFGKVAIAFSLLFFVSAVCYAQNTLPEIPSTFDPTDIENLLSWNNALYGILMIAASYFGNWIPVINRVPDTAWRVLVIAAVLGGLFVMIGWADGWQIALDYLIAGKFYELFLKFMSKTPKGKFKVQFVPVGEDEE